MACLQAIQSESKYRWKFDNKYQERNMTALSCAFALLISAAMQATAFTNPIQYALPTPCHRENMFLLFGQYKTQDSAFTSSHEKETIGGTFEGDHLEIDHERVKAASTLTKVIEEASEAEATLRKTEPVYNTLEETAIALADAPITPEEGAYKADKSSLTGEGLFWRGIVVVLCALWASNFATAKVVLAQPGVDASTFAVARFSLAALSLLPGLIHSIRKGNVSLETARGAVVCGSWVAFGYMGQLIGLLDTTPSRSCVICSLNCIFVAIVAEFMRVHAARDRGYRSNFDLMKMVPALIAVMGVAIIELKGAGGHPTWGDFISFSQPIGFGMGYLQLEELMKKQPSAALAVSAIKLAVVAISAFTFFEVSSHSASMTDSAFLSTESLDEASKQVSRLILPDFSPISHSPVAMGAVFYTGIVTTSIALWIESIAFQRVPATDASVILTTEPLFAAAASAVLVGEKFGLSDAVGAMFIVGACIYAIKMGEGKEVCDEKTMECIVITE
ncbi:hypothetical protein ACHAWX_000510 [Stephanocyclus meneghinianus]